MEKMHVTPASTKDSTIRGPESAIASPMMTKIPVPITAPMPRAVRSSAPTARRRVVSSAVSISRLLGCVTKGPGFVTTAMAGGLPGGRARLALNAPR
jgi:hypothetical protein